MQNEVTVLKFQLWKRNVTHNPVLIPALLMSSMRAESVMCVRTHTHTHTYMIISDFFSLRGNYKVFPVLYRRSLLVIYFIYVNGSVFMLTLN